MSRVLPAIIVKMVLQTQHNAAWGSNPGGEACV